jgi:ATP-dependent Lon protease
MRTDHPLAFSASIAFEQSYGGIDGDSASGAEICCLLSALTGVPIKQGIAMTGAIDQHGHIQAIGGVNEKIEGFFDACESIGPDGEHGVVIPWANAGDLMLRDDVVEACEQGRFSIHAVRNVSEALEALTGMNAAPADDDGKIPMDSLLYLARNKATEFWRKSLSSPSAIPGGGDDEDEAQNAREQ